MQSEDQPPKKKGKVDKPSAEAEDEADTWEDVIEDPNVPGPSRRRVNSEDIEVTLVQPDEKKEHWTVVEKRNQERKKRKALEDRVQESIVFGNLAHLHHAVNVKKAAVAKSTWKLWFQGKPAVEAISTASASSHSTELIESSDGSEPEFIGEYSVPRASHHYRTRRTVKMEEEAAAKKALAEKASVKKAPGKAFTKRGRPKKGSSEKHVKRRIPSASLKNTKELRGFLDWFMSLGKRTKKPALSLSNFDLSLALFSYLEDAGHNVRLGKAFAVLQACHVSALVDGKWKRSQLFQYLEPPRDYFLEIWSNAQNRYIPIDPTLRTVDQPYATAEHFCDLYGFAVAIDTDHGVVDVTPRYSSEFLTANFRKRRNGADYLKGLLQTFEPFKAKSEHARLDKLTMEEFLRAQPLPKSLVDYKNHPIYVLEKHLLKFEVIYPADQEPISTFSKSNVYPRTAVHILQREIKWEKEGRKLKPGEKPFKVVKANPNPFLPEEQKKKNATQDVFGEWQTEPYRYATVGPEDPLPRNKFGDIDLYIPEEMVPEGCVYMLEHDIARTARKMKVEHAKAVVSWAFKKKRHYAVHKGIIIHAHNAQLLRDAYIADLKAHLEDVRKITEERVFGNWSRMASNAVLLEKAKKRVEEEERQKREESEREGEPLDEVDDDDFEEDSDDEGGARAWPEANFPLSDFISKN